MVYADNRRNYYNCNYSRYLYIYIQIKIPLAPCSQAHTKRKGDFARNRPQAAHRAAQTAQEHSEGAINNNVGNPHPEKNNLNFVASDPWRTCNTAVRSALPKQLKNTLIIRGCFAAPLYSHVAEPSRASKIKILFFSQRNASFFACGAPQQSKNILCRSL